MYRRPTNSCTMNTCAFEKQFCAYVLTGTNWRPKSYLPNQVVITRTCFSWPSTSFLVMVKPKILKSSNYLMNSHFAARQLFANFSFAKLLFELS